MGREANRCCGTSHSQQGRRNRAGIRSIRHHRDRIRKDHYISVFRCRGVIGALAKTKGKAAPVAVADQGRDLCLPGVRVDAMVLPVMIGGRVTTLADAAGRGDP